MSYPTESGSRITRVALHVIVGALAFIGVVAVLLVFAGSFFVTHCERAVLARVVSPSGSRAAEHVRSECSGDDIIDYSITVGPSDLEVGDSFSGYSILTVDKSQTDSSDHSSEPAMMWWETDTTLLIVYPPGTDYLETRELSDVTVRAATRGELR